MRVQRSGNTRGKGHNFEQWEYWKKKKKSGNTSKAKPLHVFANSLCLYIISTVAELSLGAAVYFALLWV